jgi:hypothetical protein
MFFTNRYDQLDKDNQDLCIQNNELKQTIRKLESKLQTKPETSPSHLFLGKLLHTNSHNIRLYVSRCRTLFPNLTPWDFNRPIDRDHQTKLTQIILDKGYLEGSFDLIECRDKLAIVNGQHRYQALLDIMKSNPQFDMEIYCNVHPVPSFEDSLATDVFLSTNNIKNVELKDNPQEKLQNVCLRLMKQFPDGIKSNKSGRANLHRLDLKELYNVLQVNESFTDDSLTEQMMYDKLIQINHKLSLKPYTYFFKRRSQRSDKLYQGACDCGFYLGLKKGGSLGMILMNA